MADMLIASNPGGWTPDTYTEKHPPPAGITSIKLKSVISYTQFKVKGSKKYNNLSPLFNMHHWVCQ